MSRGRPRRLSADVIEVNFTQRQSDALRAMFAATGTPRAALVREAVEAFLVTNGFLEPIQPKEESKV